MRRSHNPRSCVACRRERPPREMIRVVRSRDGQIAVDEQGHLSGRGAYVCPEPQCIALCLKKKLLEKALKSPIPAEVAAKLAAWVNLDAEDMALGEQSLRNEMMAVLGMARRAGELIIGQDRVLRCLSAGDRLLTLITEDCSAAVKRALDAKNAEVYVLSGTSRSELGQLLGLRQAQIAALPVQSGFAEKLKRLLPEGGNAVE
ncbi:MAG: RNase P modulator RnpM [Pyramidobacter sp.]